MRSPEWEEAAQAELFRSSYDRFYRTAACFSGVAGRCGETTRLEVLVE